MLQKWTPDKSIDDLSFRFGPFWIQIHNIPLNRINLKNAVTFGNFAGSFIQVDKGFADRKLCSYLRVQILVYTTLPLKKGCLLRMKIIPIAGWCSNMKDCRTLHCPPIPMICLFWNCRGLGQISTVQALREFCHSHRPTILFLSEVKCSQFDRVKNIALFGVS